MILPLDVETNTLNKGNPFSIGGELVVIGLGNKVYKPEQKKEIQEIINNVQVLIGFNIKFDLHWIRKLGICFNHVRVWDCQLAEFILTGQRNPYPSLNDVATKYDLGCKLDVVKAEYWEKGIDTDQIPEGILHEYLLKDLLLTTQVYEKQLLDFEKFPKQTRTLFSLHCQDLLVLEEMEWNGITFDEDQAIKEAEKEEEKVNDIEQQLNTTTNGAPINWDSRDHLSSYLYGGSIIIEDRIPNGVFKSGERIGQLRYKRIEFKHELPRLVDPPKGSELKKEGYYATDDPTLKSIRGTKESRRIINLILERAKSRKLIGTYYRGLPELRETMGWPKSTLHGQFNQCVAATGRLSSSKPNLQNFAGVVDNLLRSRYV